MASPRRVQPDGRIGTPSFLAPTPHGLESRADGLVDHQRRPRSVGVDGTQAGGEPRHAPRRVGRAVHRVDHHHEVPIGVPGARLLGQDPDPGVREHRGRRRVGGQVVAVLVRTRAGEAPVVELPQRRGDGRCGGVQHLEQGVVVHGPTLPDAHGAPGSAGATLRPVTGMRAAR